MMRHFLSHPSRSHTKKSHSDRSRFGQIFSSRLWLMLLILPVLSGLGILAAIVPRTPTPQITESPYRYPFALNLPGTTERRQVIEREIQLHKTQLQQDPNSGLTLAALADAYWKLGKATGETAWYLKAEEMAQQSIASLPFNNDGAHLVLAQVAQARHDFQTAQQIARKVLKTSANPDARALLVSIAIAKGDLKTADTEIQPLLKTSPNLNILTLSALLQEAKGEANAIETFQFALQTEEAGEVGTSAWVRVLLGRHYFLRGQLDQAEALYQEALRMIPRYPLALLHLAALETQRGRYAEAEQLYDRVITDSQQAAHTYDHTILRGRARLKKLQNQPHAALLDKAEASLRHEAHPGHEEGSFGHRRELAQILLDRNHPKDRTEALSLMQAELKIRQDHQTQAIYIRALRANQRIAEAKQLEATIAQRSTPENDLILGLDAL